jgi:hypothetical protein
MRTSCGRNSLQEGPMLMDTDIMDMPRDLRDGKLEQEDLARLLIAFRGVVAPPWARLHLVRRSDDGLAPEYVFDEDSGMIYILD